MKRITFNRLIMLGLVTLSMQPALPPQTAKQNHYILAESNQFFVSSINNLKETISKNLGGSTGLLAQLKLWGPQGYSFYTDQNPPHISISPIPVSQSNQQTPEILRDFLRQVQLPTKFSCTRFQTLLPPMSNTAYIVVRTPSNISEGFYKLGNNIDQLLNIQRPIPQHKSHITLARITKSSGGWNINDLKNLQNELNQNYQHLLPKIQFPIVRIMYSPFRGYGDKIKLWP